MTTIALNKSRSFLVSLGKMNYNNILNILGKREEPYGII
jgi:hypothetical protein